MGYSVGVMLKKPSDVERYERTKRRAYQKLSILIEKSIPHVEGADSPTEVSFPNLVIETNEIVSLPKENEAVSDEPLPKMLNAGIQTDLTSCLLELNFDDMCISDSLIRDLKKRLRKFGLHEEAFKENDTRTKYLTGLENSKILFLIHETIAPYLPMNNTKLSTFQQLVLTLMKLRLNLDFKYLADRYSGLRLYIVVYLYISGLPRCRGGLLKFIICTKNFLSGKSQGN
ncbi:uncharacterized protein LOC127279901 [Leptopilina boulardi]|uniref:uncharacterized protein LOC127279901 n=1 Tax=Leptopilina boulardi TaxID=63433 RepID=UPI0021F612DB|nr:uncharacterized protein LOC127279901 [Leptopilina boulardi]